MSLSRSEIPAAPPAPLAAVLARFERPLVSFAFSQCRDLETARDAVQDTFLRLSQRREGVPAEVETLAPWLFTVCRNRVTDLQRKNRRLVPMNAALLTATPSPAAGPAESLQDKEQAERLRQLIAALPEKQREVITLKFTAGLSYQEISAATGLTSSYIGWLIHTAVQSLRTSFAAEMV
jgi:RNA polymerase sigma factor (sigma-70 family)